MYFNLFFIHFLLPLHIKSFPLVTQDEAFIVKQLFITELADKQLYFMFLVYMGRDQCASETCRKKVFAHFP